VNDKESSNNNNNNDRFEYIPITEPVYKNGKKLRSPCLLLDKRGLYPPFIKDADNFLYCNYKVEDDDDNKKENDNDKEKEKKKKGCDNFFPTPKSVYAHHSRKHNKHNNPNQIRKLIKQEKLKMEMESKIRSLQLKDKTTKQIPITIYATN